MPTASNSTVELCRLRSPYDQVAKRATARQLRSAPDEERCLLLPLVQLSYSVKLPVNGNTPCPRRQQAKSGNLSTATPSSEACRKPTWTRSSLALALNTTWRDRKSLSR